MNGQQNQAKDNARIYAKSADSNGYKEPLAEHTINDIKVLHRLVENLPLPREQREAIGRQAVLSVAVHDLGKAATGFQFALDSGKRWGYRHEILSAAAATALGLGDSVVFSTITHHKEIPNDGISKSSEKASRYLPREQLPNYGEDWKQIARQWFDNLPILAIEWAKICRYIGREDLTEGLGLVALSKDMTKRWLNRIIQSEYFSFEERELFSQIRGLVMSADHISSSGSPLPALIPRFLDFKICDYSLRGFQERTSKYRGNLILRAPTGSGKTEAALLWAQLNQQDNGRLFYALPTMASINAMFLRLQNNFSKDLVGLLHSRSASALYSLYESNGSDSLANQQKAKNISGLVREMYYPIRVCTPHQILRYTLQGKGWESMLSEFPNSVFIFDEIHAYNPKLTGLTMATVRYLIAHKARCMFLTATLPTFLRRLIEAEITEIGFIEPSISNPNDRKILEQKRHIISEIGGSIMDNIDLIASEAQKAESTLVVCNHIPTAQAVYTALRDKVSDTVLLHSQFTRKDRNKKENDLRDRLPKILVSTQVVEVSLNLDFEQCFTEPADIDALVQRFGRVNRYGIRKPARIGIFTEQLSKSNKIYSQNLRDKSLKTLISLQMPLSEEGLNIAADEVYGSGYNGEDLTDYQSGLNYPGLKNWEDCLTAGTSENWINKVIDEKEGTIDLLHEQFLKEYDILTDRKLFIEANNLLIPVQKWALTKLEIDTERDPWIIHRCEYNEEIGLIIPRE